jgi:hypothetical protein
MGIVGVCVVVCIETFVYENCAEQRCEKVKKIENRAKKGLKNKMKRKLTKACKIYSNKKEM